MENTEKGPTKSDFNKVHGNEEENPTVEMEAVKKDDTVAPDTIHYNNRDEMISTIPTTPDGLENKAKLGETISIEDVNRVAVMESARKKKESDRKDL